ncbi:GTPase Obg [uncultured archaeon]|nr:GTPase Obg [uncultured archaeon]
MTVNAHPEYINAEKDFYKADNDEDRLIALEKMISVLPGHKGAEKLRAQIKLRYKRLKEKIAKEKKSKKGGSKAGIKKEDMQAVIVGKTKSGKSSLISLLTNAKPEIAEYEFTTKFPIVGMMDYNSIGIQLIEVPAIESEYYDRGIVNSADTILFLVTDLAQIPEVEKITERAPGKKIIVFNKIDLLSENEKRKISATLQSKKHNFILISTKTKEGIEELKEKLFKSFGRMRIYTKEPGKEKSRKPIILFPESTVKHVAEKILKGFSSKIKETRIWGPSSKYPGQVVGLAHKMKDLDVVEFKTR